MPEMAKRKNPHRLRNAGTSYNYNSKKCFTKVKVWLLIRDLYAPNIGYTLVCSTGK